MKEFFKIINNRKTIREFTNEKIDKETLDEIFSALMHSATSNGLQQASIIRVTDQDKKDALAEICKQEYVSRMPELLIFIVDNYMNYRLIKDNNVDFDAESNVDIFFQGFTDAVILAQSAVSLIESSSLGAVYLGSILNNPREVIKVLDLPELTFPVVGLGFGYPNQEPQIKPKIPMELRVFENSYKVFDDYKKTFEDYDREMQTYYDLRDANRRVDSFTNQVIKKYKNPLELRNEIIKIAEENGYKF